jgi:hypothetical protein
MSVDHLIDPGRIVGNNRHLYSGYEKKKAKSGDRPEHCQAIRKTCHMPTSR